MRQSGILLHISSLPSSYGIGTIGKTAREFVDFLSRAGQQVWQMLPINPTGYGDSPYQALSTFAGNPYFIDPELLKEKGLLQKEELEQCDFGRDPGRVDFGCLYVQRPALLRKAYERFKNGGNGNCGDGGCESGEENYKRFVQKEAWWLKDYALFMALKEEHGQRPWTEWEPGVRFRRPEALQAAEERLQDTMEYHYFLQYLFYTQWEQFHAYASSKGIALLGDVPIYVPMDSADVWAAPEHFQLDENRLPVVIAGCPPDAFSADGQRWGNPIYDWNRMEQEGFDWWIKRLRMAARHFDMVRIDHFRGIESYWAIPAQEETAVNGRWVKGPGEKLIHAIQKNLPGTRFIAEDLGYLTPEVMALQQKSGYPGMKVLQFAFDSREAGNYLPYTYCRNSVCYTGTHDNETLVQWQKNVGAESLCYAMEYLGVETEDRLSDAMIRCGMGCVSDLFIAQMQDYLGLGEEARMNHPSTLNDKNWTWRMLPSQETDELADRIYRLTKLYGRISTE